ncbi:carboxypeptidase-like regulatory domain-containing protein [Thalassoroseus pseudoceratinae]|uniref:carboxypeptidase-like regulatory domain-containing protein n=1 Tax=Thalassoroseus pseudoceratinae TaxID=2713176 RepID=UPI00141F8666|nr:carboxypeptidase-like regulatory domain-containing protein [Thalassoroseus pseudoceratinae]
MTVRSIVNWAFATLIVGSLVGCGGATQDEWTEKREKVVPVSGVVLVNGKPIEGATVNFHSETKDVTAHGRTDAQGQFELTTYEAADGAVPGKHKVTVKKHEVKTVPNPEDPELGPISSEEIWHTPKVYGSIGTTPLTFDVGPEGNSDVELKLEQ